MRAGTVASKRIKLNPAQRIVLYREFVDKYLVHPSTCETRVKFWMDKGFSAPVAYQLIGECNRQYRMEYADVVTGAYTKDTIASLIEDLMTRTKGTNDKLYLDALKVLLSFHNIKLDENGDDTTRPVEVTINVKSID